VKWYKVWSLGKTNTQSRYGDTRVLSYLSLETISLIR